MVDRAGSILYASAAASSITGEAGLFQIVGTSLVARHPSDNTRLRSALSRSGIFCERETFMASGCNSVTGHFVSVSHLHSGGNRSHVFLVVVQQCDGDEDFADGLRRLFRFSPGEIVISSALVDGLDYEQIAKLRGSKVNTIRTQINNMMLKTQTHGQRELVSLLTRIASIP